MELQGLGNEIMYYTSRLGKLIDWLVIDQNVSHEDLEKFAKTLQHVVDELLVANSFVDYLTVTQTFEIVRKTT